MKSVMILGAAAGQVPFIERCKSSDYRVIVISPEGNYPGFKMADKRYYFDTRDKEGILKAARLENIDAILSDQTDVSIPSVAYVSEKMGLKSIGYQTSLSFTDKYRMREKAKGLGIAVPDFAKASTLQEAQAALQRIGFPAMIKPVDSSGSRGVFKINGAEELERYFDRSLSFSHEKSVIVEGFIRGREYIADGLAIDRRYLQTDLGIKEYFRKENLFISKMCMFSSARSINDPAELAVLETDRAVVEGFGLEFGLTHGEYIVGEDDGKAYLVEVAARGGGLYISSDLTPRACGINTNDILIDFVVEGKSVPVEKLSLTEGVSAWVCFELAPGRIIEIKGRDLVKTLPGVFRADIDDLYVGEYVEEMVNDANKKGPVLIEAGTREECYRYIQRVKDTLDVVVDSGGAMAHIIW